MITSHAPYSTLIPDPSNTLLSSSKLKSINTAMDSSLLPSTHLNSSRHTLHLPAETPLSPSTFSPFFTTGIPPTLPDRNSGSGDDNPANNNALSSTTVHSVTHLEVLYSKFPTTVVSTNRCYSPQTPILEPIGAAFTLSPSNSHAGIDAPGAANGTVSATPLVYPTAIVASNCEPIDAHEEAMNGYLPIKNKNTSLAKTQIIINEITATKTTGRARCLHSREPIPEEAEHIVVQFRAPTPLALPPSTVDSEGSDVNGCSGNNHHGRYSKKHTCNCTQRVASDSGDGVCKMYGCSKNVNRDGDSCDYYQQPRNKKNNEFSVSLSEAKKYKGHRTVKKHYRLRQQMQQGKQSGLGEASMGTADVIKECTCYCHQCQNHHRQFPSQADMRNFNDNINSKRVNSKDENVFFDSENKTSNDKKGRHSHSQGTKAKDDNRSSKAQRGKRDEENCTTINNTTNTLSADRRYCCCHAAGTELVLDGRMESSITTANNNDDKNNNLKSKKRKRTARKSSTKFSQERVLAPSPPPQAITMPTTPVCMTLPSPSGEATKFNSLESPSWTLLQSPPLAHHMGISTEATGDDESAAAENNSCGLKKSLESKKYNVTPMYQSQKEYKREQDVLEVELMHPKYERRYRCQERRITITNNADEDDRMGSAIYMSASDTLPSYHGGRLRGNLGEGRERQDDGGGCSITSFSSAQELEESLKLSGVKHIDQRIISAMLTSREQQQLQRSVSVLATPSLHTQGTEEQGVGPRDFHLTNISTIATIKGTPKTLDTSASLQGTYSLLEDSCGETMSLTPEESQQQHQGQQQSHCNDHRHHSAYSRSTSRSSLWGCSTGDKDTTEVMMLSTADTEDSLTPDGILLTHHLPLKRETMNVTHNGMHYSTNVVFEQPYCFYRHGKHLYVSQSLGYTTEGDCVVIKEDRGYVSNSPSLSPALVPHIMGEDGRDATKVIPQFSLGPNTRRQIKKKERRLMRKLLSQTENELNGIQEGNTEVEEEGKEDSTKLHDAARRNGTASVEMMKEGDEEKGVTHGGNNNNNKDNLRIRKVYSELHSAFCLDSAARRPMTDVEEYRIRKKRQINMPKHQKYVGLRTPRNLRARNRLVNNYITASPFFRHLFARATGELKEKKNDNNNNNNNNSDNNNSQIKLCDYHGESTSSSSLSEDDSSPASNENEKDNNKAQLQHPHRHRNREISQSENDNNNESDDINNVSVGSDPSFLLSSFGFPTQGMRGFSSSSCPNPTSSFFTAVSKQLRDRFINQNMNESFTDNFSRKCSRNRGENYRQRQKNSGSNIHSLQQQQHNQKHHNSENVNGMIEHYDKEIKKQKDASHTASVRFSLLNTKLRGEVKRAFSANEYVSDLLKKLERTVRAYLVYVSLIHHGSSHHVKGENDNGGSFESYGQSFIKIQNNENGAALQYEESKELLPSLYQFADFDNLNYSDVEDLVAALDKHLGNRGNLIDGEKMSLMDVLTSALPLISHSNTTKEGNFSLDSPANKSESGSKAKSKNKSDKSSHSCKASRIVLVEGGQQQQQQSFSSGSANGSKQTCAPILWFVFSDSYSRLMAHAVATYYKLTSWSVDVQKEESEDESKGPEMRKADTDKQRITFMGLPISERATTKALVFPDKALVHFLRKG